MTEQFPEFAAALARLPDAVLDGELVVPDQNGRSDFEKRFGAATCCSGHG